MTNSNQKERFQTKIAMLEQNNQVLQNKCEEYLGELIRTRKALDVTVDALKNVQKNSPENYTATQAVFLLAKNSVFVNNALEQITTLEQKD